MSFLGPSWKTTLSGAVTALGAAALTPQARQLAGDAVCDWVLLLLPIGLAFLGLSARDNNVTSERAGAKPGG